MGTKENLLALLQDSPQTYLSGQELAQKLGVSRAAVCKAAKALRDQGYEIHAVTNKGYSLQKNADILDVSTVSRLLQDDFWKISYFPSVSSTNSLLKELAAHGALRGTLGSQLL